MFFGSRKGLKGRFDVERVLFFLMGRHMLSRKRTAGLQAGRGPVSRLYRDLMWRCRAIVELEIYRALYFMRFDRC